MQRLTRLTTILLQLQSKKVVTANDIAKKYGITKRTVYRDIKALEETGVPIIGEAGIGYSLMEGYKMPPVMFTEKEVNALITAEKIIAQNKDKSLAQEYMGAVTKVKALLKYTDKEKSELLENRMMIYRQGKKDSNFLSVIQTAITNMNILSVRYHSLYKDENTNRNIEPLAVYFTNDNWIMIAWCRLRKDLREFRLDRIKQLTEPGLKFSQRQFSFTEYISQHGA